MGVTPEATELLERQVSQLGEQSIGVEADGSKIADLEMLVEKAVSAFGRVDIMVNNAGVETRTSILDTTEDQYEKVMTINLKSAFFGTQIAAKQMIFAAGDGASYLTATTIFADGGIMQNSVGL
jgi:glucose 1-dehydrogenase